MIPCNAPPSPAPARANNTVSITHPDQRIMFRLRGYRFRDDPYIATVTGSYQCGVPSCSTEQMVGLDVPTSVTAQSQHFADVADECVSARFPRGMEQVTAALWRPRSAECGKWRATSVLAIGAKSRRSPAS